MKDKTSKMDDGLPFSLLPTETSSSAHKILASLEGKKVRQPGIVRKKNQGERRQQHFFVPLLVICCLGLFAGGVAAVFYLDGFLPIEQVADAPPQPMLAGDPVAVAMVQQSEQRIAELSEVDDNVAVIESTGDWNMQSILEADINQENPLAKLSQQPNEAQKSSPLSVQKPAPVRKSTARRPKAKKQDEDVMVLTSVLEAVYQVEGIPEQASKEVKGKLAVCSKLEATKKEKCTHDVCAEFWGKLPECARNSSTSRK